MYEMEGALLWPRRTRAASCLASPALRAARPGRTPVRGAGFPAPSHVCQGALSWCLFPTVTIFLHPSASVAQGSATIHSKFFLYPHDTHRAGSLIRTSPRLSTGLYTSHPQVTG